MNTTTTATDLTTPDMAKLEALIGRAYDAASCLICTPGALHQGKVALGAQAGVGRLKAVVTEGGFTRFREAVRTPFNVVLEARP